MSNVCERQWTTEAGLEAACMYVNKSHRYGYVAVPSGHPLHSVDYSDHSDALVNAMKQIRDMPPGERGIIPLFCWDGKRASPENVFDVHGSLTYSAAANGYAFLEKSGAWVFGFGCAHDMDASNGHSGGVRTKDYVVSECERLAEQLAAIKPVGLVKASRA